MSRLSILKGDEIYRNDSVCVLIYKGILQSSNTPVAIKEQIFPSIDQANRGLQEAHRAMSLSHPNIIRTYECYIEGTAGGTFRTVLVSELMAEDLFKALTRRQNQRNYWTEQELMGMLIQVVAAMSFAERNGVCHRDIKPQNLFTNEDQSVVKVGDFGTAATVDIFGDRKSTLVGSPFFLSPELKRSFSAQFAGNLGAKPSYDPYKSDVYSLGVTFLYMGTLQTPVGLLDMDNLLVKTEEALGILAAYGTLQWYLRWMLAVEEQNRAYFHELEASLQQYGYIPGTIPQGQSSVGQVWQAEVAVEPLGPLQTEVIPSQCPNCGQFYAELNSSYCQTCNSAAQSYAYPSQYEAFSRDNSCLGCPAPMRKTTKGRIPLPCGHRFHDVNCFYAYLEHTNQEFVGQAVEILCPRCPGQPIDDKNGLLASAFGSFELFRKRREGTRKKYCTVCHSQENLKHRQECGHKYCPDHWPAPKQCTYCLPEWRDI